MMTGAQSSTCDNLPCIAAIVDKLKSVIVRKIAPKLYIQRDEIHNTFAVAMGMKLFNWQSYINDYKRYSVWKTKLYDKWNI